MVIGFTKIMYTRIIPQRQVKRDAQQRKIDGFIYSFMTNISSHNLDWNEIEDVLNECFINVFNIQNSEYVKDIEITLDIPSDKYSVRFSSSKELNNIAYAGVINWYIQAYDGSYSSVTDGKPVEYINDDTNYFVEIEVIKLSDEQLDNLCKQIEKE